MSRLFNLSWKVILCNICIFWTGFFLKGLRQLLNIGCWTSMRQNGTGTVLNMLLLEVLFIALVQQNQRVIQAGVIYLQGSISKGDQRKSDGKGWFYVRLREMYTSRRFWNGENNMHLLWESFLYKFSWKRILAKALNPSL